MLDRRSSNAVLANSPLLKSCWRALASTFESPAPETAELPHFGDWRPHCIWLDVQLPGMSGLDAAAKIRAVPAVKPDPSSGAQVLAQVSTLPDDLKTQLLETVLLLETERIAAVIGLISVENPTFAAELSRRADASEFTPIMRAIQSGR